MKSTDIARYRLRSQHIANPTFDEPAALVRWFGAVQAQDYNAALWAVALRTRGAGRDRIEAAIERREIIRTWPMRGTLHFVAAQDVRWMLRLLTPRVIAATAARYRQLGLDGATLAKAERLVVTALGSGRVLPRPALYHALTQGGVATDDSRGLHIVGHLAMRGVICFGPHAGKQAAFVLLDEWVPNAKDLDRRDALGELAARYFRSHGPALVQDFAWWSGLTIADARAGIEHATGQLATEVVDGRTYWFDPAAQPARAGATRAYLLPVWDEYTVAYRDRSAVVPQTFAKRVNAGGGILNPTVVINGRVVGTWKIAAGGRGSIAVQLAPFRRLSAAQMHAVRRAAARYAAFRGVPVTVAQR